MRRLLPTSLLSLPALLAALSIPAAAFEYRADQTVHIKSDEVIEGDLYVFGEKVTIEGTVQGDLIAFGSQIEIKGPVEGDLIAAGQTILVESQLSDDARIAGQVLKFAPTAKVAGDLVAAGLSLELEAGSTIGGDVVFAGYQGDLSGDVTGGVRAGTSNFRLAGLVGGDVHLEAGGEAGSPPATAFGPPPALSMPSVPAGLTVASTAKIDGDLDYRGRLEAKVEDGAKLANPIKFTEQHGPAAAPPPTTTQIVLGKVRHFACVAILGLAMVLVFPGWSTTLADNVRTRPLASLLGGVAAIVGFIVLLLIVLVAMIAIAVLAGFATLSELSAVTIVLGLLSMIGLAGGFWLFTTYLASAIAGLAIGRMALRSPGASQLVVALLAGLVIFALASSILYAGGIVAFVGMLLALGGLALWLISGRELQTTASEAAKPSAA